MLVPPNTLISDAVWGWTQSVLDRPRMIQQAPTSDMADVLGRHVHAVEDSSGHQWFLKIESRRGAWRAEVRAYRQWIPRTGDLAPTLLAANRDLLTLVISAVPGERPTTATELDHRLAGGWLRRLHDSRRPRPRPPGFGGVRVLRQLRRAHPGVLDQDEHDFAIGQARLLHDHPETRNVPNHGDFRAHNWLVDGDGVLRVIDFGNARWAPRAADFSALAYGAWWGRPELRDAFAAGYGRRVFRAQQDATYRRLCVRAALQVYRGQEFGLEAKIVRGQNRLQALMLEHTAT